MGENDGHDLSGLYRDCRLRLTALVSGLDARALATQVPACPDWTVRDVVAHLTAIADDTVGGRLRRPPTDEQTAAQVARLADVGVPDMLSQWTEVAPQFEHILGASDVWPALIDVASHEQDIRGAVGMPGARDSDTVRHCSAWLLSALRVPVPLLVVTEDGEVLTGPGGPGGPCGPAELTLSTSRFEAFRWRMGRRSLAQIAALNWSGDPCGVLSSLSVFEPAARDIEE